MQLFLTRVRWPVVVIYLLASGMNESRGLARAYQDLEHAITAIKNTGGIVVRDQSRQGSPVKSVRLNGTRVTDAELAHLEGMTELESLSLISTHVTDAGLAHLSGLAGLRSLIVS